MEAGGGMNKYHYAPRQQATKPPEKWLVEHVMKSRNCNELAATVLLQNFNSIPWYVNPSTEFLKRMAEHEAKRPKNPVKGAKLAIGTVEITEPNQLPDQTADQGGIFVTAHDERVAAQLRADLNRRESNLRLAQESAAGLPARAETNSLVQRCKSPTSTKRKRETWDKEAKISRYLQQLRLKDGVDVAAVAARMGVSAKPERVTMVSEPLINPEIGSFGGVNVETGEVTGPNYFRSPVARLSYRDWSNEYRLRVSVDTNPAEPPPEQGGDRKTTALSQRGARNILESGAYIAAVRGGYTTFLTLTFDTAARERITSGESTIGKEVSRFFDGASKLYRRGWVAEKTVTDHQNGFDCVANDAEPVPSAGDALDYLWCAEAPLNADGAVNPHCHVLMRWTVEPHLFRAWAKRIENLWGHGFAKLERIRNADAASGYLLKALGYLTKGESQDQGEIKGNRYNISKSARAPSWEVLAEFHAQHMAAIIAEVGEKLARRAAPIRGEIAAAKAEVTKAAEAAAVLKNKGDLDKAAQVKARIERLTQKIKDAHAQLQQIPARVNDHYQITFKSADTLRKFLDWSAGLRLWDAIPKASQLQPSKLSGSRWANAIKKTREKYRHILPKLEEKAALWPQLLSETWRCIAPEPTTPTGAIYTEYSQWLAKS